MDRDTELELVAGLKGGDERAFDRVYEEYRPRLFSFVLRLVGRREVAEELSQEAWLRLATRACALRDDTRLAPWLFTVARNLCASLLRARGLDLARTVDPADLGLPGGDTTPAGELRWRLERAMARLPTHYREALLLVGVEGLTQVEAAAVCGVRPEALRKRVERARNLLAAELGEDRPRATHR
ncbi:MAG TPA: RNA polymerase sigma factor [Vicinamibacteria bacterium]|nr:RNA polymerase sigma factor [Vicinamibacteria bacterium]